MYIEDDQEMGKWTHTDVDQWGRKIRDNVYEFKENFYDNEGDLIEVKQRTIDLTEYTPNEVESSISAYGYSLLPWEDGYITLMDYGKDKNWIIAECIFETEL